MKKPIQVMVIVTFSIVCSAILVAADKSSYDIEEPRLSRPGAFAEVEAGFPQGWILSAERGEASLLRDGCFTLGTGRGLSGTRLDSATSVTYGHPFGKTSYPIFHVDGVWGAIPDFFSSDSGAVTIDGDSITLTHRSAGLVEAQVVIRLVNSGRQFRLSARLTNRDTVAHSLGIGYALDPALGNRGDGVAELDGAMLLRDTVLTAAMVTGKALRVLERSTAFEGMRMSLGFPDATPASIVVANWSELLGHDEPAFVPPVDRALYDLVLKSYWSPVQVSPGSSAGWSMEVGLLTPDFGQSVFLRWDVPGFLTLDEGMLFPGNMTSIVGLTNLSTAFRGTATIQVHVASPVVTAAPSTDVLVGSGSQQYVTVPLGVRETYEDKVVELSLAYREGGILLDSLVRPVFIPATPISDTGLVVRVDSILIGSYPIITALFEVEREATQQRLYHLGDENVFLSEDGVRITDFWLGKDTTGGLGEADIIFVLDVTGSMGDEIDAVKDNIIEFTDSLTARGVDFQLAMVTFLDEIENVYPFTSDPTLFKQTAAVQYAHGGGDGPENSLDALYRASEYTFREGSNRILIWITDADYHEQDWATSRNRQEVVTRLLMQDIIVHAIGPTIYQTDWYNPIIEPTGGQFYDIYGNFRDILLDISRLQGISRYALRYQTPLASSGTRQVTLEVHYAGLGGFGTALYTPPGGERAGSLSCYPNPFNPLLTIRVGSPVEARAVITIYNLLGQEIRQFQSHCGPGQTDVVWDAKDNRGTGIATGLYLVRVSLVSPDNRVMSMGLEKVLYLK